MLRLVKLTRDNIKPFDLINTISSNENEFKNTAFGLSFNDFKKWLIQQDDWSYGKNLPYGYVPQIIYWLYDDDIPIGIGKIRLKLTDESRENGGNIGYAIGRDYRGKGHGTQFIKLLIMEANKLGIDEILFTVEKYNPTSKHVIEKAGGRVIKENNKRWYLTF